MANKRLTRLEASNLTDSPAFQTATKDGKVRFGVRGKNYNQLQQEYARLRNFLEAETSTIRGINRNLKNIAQTTGIKYKTIGELRQKTANFFQLSSMVEQYLRTVEDMASAIGYQKIWEAVNQYTQENKIDLADTEMTVEKMQDIVAEVVKETKGKDPDGKAGNKQVFFLI